jgi:hypothetical protein
MIPPLQFQRQFLDRIGNLAPFRQLLDLVPDVAFFMKDRAGRFVMHNRRSCEFFQISSEREVLGKTDYDFFSHDRAELYVAWRPRGHGDGRPIINAIAPSPEESDKIIVYSKVPVYGKNGRGDRRGRHPPHRGRAERHAPLVRPLLGGTQTHPPPLRRRDRPCRAGRARRASRRASSNAASASFWAPRPASTYMHVRINASRTLLETTDRTIADIALSVGLLRPQPFHAHHSAALMSCSPKQYRDHHRQQAAPQPDR